MKKFLLLAFVLLASVGSWAQTTPDIWVNTGEFTDMRAGSAFGSVHIGSGEGFPTSLFTGYLVDGVNTPLPTLNSPSQCHTGNWCYSGSFNSEGSHWINAAYTAPGQTAMSTATHQFFRMYVKFPANATMGPVGCLGKIMYLRNSNAPSQTLQFDLQGRSGGSGMNVYFEYGSDSALSPAAVIPFDGNYHYVEVELNTTTGSPHQRAWIDDPNTPAIDWAYQFQAANNWYPNFEITFGPYINPVGNNGCTAFSNATVWVDDMAESTQRIGPTPSGSLAVSTVSLPNAQINQTYSQTLTAIGGTSPYTWSITAGALPTGLSLNGATGVISGTPSGAGTANFTVRVTDSLAATASKALSIIVASLTSVTVSPASSTIGTGATQQFSATATYSDASTLAVTPSWNSSATNVATIGISTGLATACSGSCPALPATANITGTYQSVTSNTAVLTVASNGGGAPSPGPSDTVVFQDGFESGNINLWYRDGTSSPSKFVVATTPTHGGTKALKVVPDTAVDKLVARLNCPTDNSCPGYTEVYAKYYVQWASGSKFDGHMVHLSGSHTTNFWSTFGKGGIKPDDSTCTTDDSACFFYVGIDPEFQNQHGSVVGLYPFQFYTYWPDMVGTTPNAFGNYVTQTNANQTDSWNAGLVGTAQPNTTGVWHEVVAHVKANTVGSTDGKQELWVDGIKVISQTLRFRTTSATTVNMFAMPFFLTTAAVGTVYVDDVTIWTPGSGGSSGGPVASSYFGMHTLDPTNHWPTVSIGGMRPANVSWGAIETARGVYNWTTLDAWVAAAQSHGTPLDYLFLNTPSWAASASTLPPTVMQDWNDFVTALVTRYKGKIQSYELWNEPNSSSYWTGTIPQLVTLAQQAYPIIKAIDPAATVLTPAPTWTATTAYQWMDSYLTAGGGAYADVVAYHAYTGNPPNGESVLTVINGMNTVLTNHSFTGESWITESGWGLNSDLPVASDQTAFLAQRYLLSWGQGVKRFYWYQWDNTLWGTLWTSGGGVNQAGAAYQQVYNWMVGATSTAPCTQGGDSTYTCTFTRGNGYQARAVWNRVAPTAVSYPSQFTHYRDLAGRNIALTPGGTITATAQPILLETAAPAVPRINGVSIF